MSKNGGFLVADTSRMSKADMSDLTLLIHRMQKNADQAEQDVLYVEEKLALDSAKAEKGQSFQYQEETSIRLADTDSMLKELQQDVEKVKKFQHPQASEIEQDVKNLRRRWQQNTEVHHRIYELKRLEGLTSQVNWDVVLKGKQRQVTEGAYGPELADVEQQIATHNILQKEIDAYQSQLGEHFVGYKEEFASIESQYKDLMESSQLREKHLSSLYDYLRACGKELSYLRQQQEKVFQQDWSERSVNLIDVCQQDQNFRSTNIQSHETESYRLQDQGDLLIKAKHPASSTIKVQRDSVRDEWARFLCVCICREKHLINLRDYRKYQADTESLRESLQKLRAPLEPVALRNKSGAELLQLLEESERGVQRAEQLLTELRKRSAAVLPLRLRHVPPSSHTPVEAICDWDAEKVSVAQGEKLTLRSNSRDVWEVKGSDGTSKTLPGACLLVSPPDTEASAKLDRLEKELVQLKQRRASAQASHHAQSSETAPLQRQAPVPSSPHSSRVEMLVSQLDRLDKEFLQARQDTVVRMRTPLDHGDPVKDLSRRLQEQEVTDEKVRALEQEIAAIQRELERRLAQTPGDATLSTLLYRLSGSKTKHDDVANLANLYTKRVQATIFLENQIRNVDTFLSPIETQLAAQEPIGASPGALQSRTQELQSMQQHVAQAAAHVLQLGRDMDSVRQLCVSLEQDYQEFCPELYREQTEVGRLAARHDNMSKQLQQRESLLQEAAVKNQAFQSASQSLNSVLVNVPANDVVPSDGVLQINNMINTQKRLVEDLKRKKEDLSKVKALSLDLQNALSDYDSVCERYQSWVDEDQTTNSKPQHSFTLANAVNKQEKNLVNLYAKVLGENEQRFQQMGVAKSLAAQHNSDIIPVVVEKRVQVQSQQKGLDEVDGYKNDLAEETVRRSRAEDELDSYRKRATTLRSRRGVERVEEKETVQYYRDSKLEVSLNTMRDSIHAELLRRAGIQAEIDSFNRKIIIVEQQLRDTEPKLVTKVVTEFERDPKLEVEASKIREEIVRLKEDIQIKRSETIQTKTEINMLEQKKPSIKQVVVKKELVQLEKNPEMLQAVKTFQVEITDERQRCKDLNNDIFETRRQINTLERIIPTIMPKIITKEIKTVEKDPVGVSEFNQLKASLQEETAKSSSFLEEISQLQQYYSQVEKLKPKVEVKETTKEIFRVDPDTEVLLLRLKKELQETSRNQASIEKEISQVMTELESHRAQKPRLELKELTQQVVKEERSPEIIKEMQRLKEHVSSLLNTYDKTHNQLKDLRKERDEWRERNSKVETKVVTKDFIRYENDPLLEKEADRLRREVREETQRRRATEETLFDLQNKYLQLERQKPEEKVVMHEIVRLQKDPTQLMEHERLSKNVDKEIKSRRNLELEVQQLRNLLKEKRAPLNQMDERQKKMQVEEELRLIRSRIAELENTPLTEKVRIEEVLRVERDPELDKAIEKLRMDISRERDNVSHMEKDIQNLSLKLEILQREKSVEKKVYMEVIRVAKDEAVEAERDRLREQVSQEKNARCYMEDEFQHLNGKLTRLKTMKENTLQETNSLSQMRDMLLKERDRLSTDLQQMGSEKKEISVSFQLQSKLLSERNQINKQKVIKMESDVHQLERDILEEKDKINKKEMFIKELQGSLKEDIQETTQETNVSTRITILDPETGKMMSPYDAYMEGLIDRNHYFRLQQLECDWEEVTSMTADGKATVLLDRKSGKQYPIEKAIKEGRLSQSDLQRYRDGKIPISEFALLVAGESKKKPIPKEPKATVSSQRPPYNSQYSQSYNQPLSQQYNQPLSQQYNSKYISSVGEEYYPISGLIDIYTNTRMSVRSALTRRLVDQGTAQKLLEAQAATGGIVDVGTKARHSVHKAVTNGLIDRTMVPQLLSAQKAFTGMEDPLSKERLSVGQAVKKGWVTKETAMRCLHFQLLTGGLVDPNKPGRFSPTEAAAAGVIDSEMVTELQDDSAYAKDLIDPVTREKISYKEALDRCKKDPITELLMLPVAAVESRSSLASSSQAFF